MRLTLSPQHRFRYDDFSQRSTIRLFRLNVDSGSDISTLSGGLATTKLTNAPEYYALSYCWGTRRPNVAIQCNGTNLLVTETLAQALVQIRQHLHQQLALSSEVHWLWIDQICVNQVDLAERAQQVQLMGAIYSQAIRRLSYGLVLSMVPVERCGLSLTRYTAFSERSVRQRLQSQRLASACIPMRSTRSMVFPNGPTLSGSTCANFFNCPGSPEPGSSKRSRYHH